MRALAFLGLAVLSLLGRPSGAQARPSPALARTPVARNHAAVAEECRHADEARVLSPQRCAPRDAREAAARLAVADRWQESSPPARASAWAIAASAAVPGAGQVMLGVDRFVPYLAAEAYFWIQYAAHARNSRRERDAYRALAARVARDASSGSLPHGDFAYYERMKHYAESGRFSLRADGVLEPETDTTTYNGAMWMLARRTYWPDIDAPPDTASPEWHLAVSFYRRRGYDAPYLWSWGRAPLEYGEFRRLMRQSNESNRKALQDVGVIIANHLLSTVDALVTVRVRRRPVSASAGAGWEVSGALPLSALRR